MEGRGGGVNTSLKNNFESSSSSSVLNLSGGGEPSPD